MLATGASAEVTPRSPRGTKPYGAVTPRIRSESIENQPRQAPHVGRGTGAVPLGSVAGKHGKQGRGLRGSAGPPQSHPTSSPSTAGAAAGVVGRRGLAGPLGDATSGLGVLPLLPKRRTSVSEALRGAIEEARTAEMAVRQRVRLHLKQRNLCCCELPVGPPGTDNGSLETCLRNVPQSPMAWWLCSWCRRRT